MVVGSCPIPGKRPGTMVYTIPDSQLQAVILHAGEYDGALYLWGETDQKGHNTGVQAEGEAGAHPLGASIKEMSESLRGLKLRLKSKKSSSRMAAWLPTADAGPVLSSDAAGRQSGENLMVAPWTIPVIRLPPMEAVDLLCAVMGKRTLDSGAAVGADLAYWVDVLRFAGFQVARQQFLPDLVADGDAYAAAWTPVFMDGDAERFSGLAERMPGAARALAPSGAGPPRRGAPEVLRRAVAVMVDYLVRAAASGSRAPMAGRRRRFSNAHELWLYALKATGPVAGLHEGMDELAASVREWRRPLDIRTEHPLRLCFRLEEPDGEAGDDGAWRVRYLLQSRDDPSLMVPVNEVWDGGADWAPVQDGIGTGELLLALLGHASKIAPGIAAGLMNGDMGGYDTDTAGAYEFLTGDAAALRQAGHAVMLPAWWGQGGGKPRLVAHAGSGGFKTPGGMLSLDTIVSFDWEAALGDQKMTREELEDLARMKAPLVRVRGQWTEVNVPEIQSAISFLKKGRRQVPFRDVIRAALGVADVPPGLDFGGVKADGHMAELLDRLDKKAGFEELGQPGGFVGALRPYQLRGYSWLAFLGQWGLGGCLADDMGLGKTIQVLAMVQRDWPSSRSPVLLVCPMSVMNNWQREAARFTPELPVMIHHGAERIRDGEFKAAAERHAIVVTSYGLLHRDIGFMTDIPWRGVVLDEAQNIKNPQTKQSEAVRMLPAGYRFALTGTPVENHLGDLWSIMEFLNPGFLGTQGRFKRNFLGPIQADQDGDAAERLRRATGPFILRRLKTDKAIISDLPEKMEMKVFCPLTKEQASLYASVLEETERALRSAGGIKRKGIILSTLSRLKQVCNHPAQFLGDNSSVANRSGKLARLTEMLEEVLAVGDRALVFSQFAVMGGILQRHLQERFGLEVLFLHGGVPKARRDEMVERFQSDGGPQIFVLSLKAGGTGLNLTSASHVFHFDRWWNPAVESQATDRAFRIGQRRNVQVHKMVCVGTLEEKIDQMIETKKAVAEKVVGTGEGWLTEMSNDDLRKVLALSREAAGA